MLVRDNDRELIVEHGRGIREINAVLVEIDARALRLSHSKSAI
jgi:hypothetical protein